MDFFRPPSVLDFSSPNLASTWQRFRQNFENYMLAAEKNTKPEITKIAIFLNCIGDEGVAIYNSFALKPAKTESPATESTAIKPAEITLSDVLSKFDDYCSPKKNVVYERYNFFRCCQKEGQSIDSFVTELKNLASTCEFDTQKDSLIRDRVVLGIGDCAMRERLLREPDLTLQNAINFVRSAEVSKRQIVAMSSELRGAAIDSISRDRSENRQQQFRCKFCGRQHQRGRCPANGRSCFKCGGMNHFGSVCRSERHTMERAVDVREIAAAGGIGDDAEVPLYIDALDSVAGSMSLRRNGLVDSIQARSKLVWNSKVPNTEMEKFRKSIESKYNQHFGSYWEFHKWSVENYVDFWKEVWSYLDIVSSTPYTDVALRTGDGFLDVDWFSGAKFNFAENILRIRDDRLALICADEMGFEEKVTFAEMFEEVKQYAAAFRKHGLQVGDRVACYMSNRKEAIFAMLATTAVGAIWSGPLPYYGARAASNIVNIMEPKILITCDHLQDDGEHFYPIDNLPVILEKSPSIEKVIIVATKEETYSRDISNIPNAVFLSDFLLSGRTADGTVPDLEFEQLPFDHPVAINFSSGTTGLPKGPVHGAGTIIAILRDFAFHLNMKSGDVVFSCYPVGWSLWDYPVPSLALGVTLFLYDGSPYYLRKGRNVWDIMHEFKVKFAFLVTAIVDKLEKNKVYPSSSSTMDHLKIIGIGGSPVKHPNINYLINKVQKDLFVGSMYGATEVFGAFSGFDLNSPAYAGEIQAPSLGLDIQCYDQEGNSIIGQRGELVIATPSPSFPVYLWKDTDNRRLNDIYFSKYKGVWSQNDECWINPKTKGIVVIGRSDDTLKQNGERFGSGDIYFAIHQMEELSDYICVGQDGNDGDERAVLFVKMKKGHVFTPQLRDKIAHVINKEFWIDYVPKAILETPDVPYNLNNKRMESVVRRIVATNQIPEVNNIRNPECLRHFCDIPEVVNYSKK